MIIITNIMIGHIKMSRKVMYVLSTFTIERRMIAMMGIKQQMSIRVACDRPFLVEV